jgi:hypothetical protein
MAHGRERALKVKFVVRKVEILGIWLKFIFVICIDKRKLGYF